MKNVLFLCLSPVKSNASIAKYSFSTEQGDIEYLDGYQTNEAPTKSVIKKLAMEGSKQRMNSIIMINSDAVNKTIVINEDSELNRADLGLSEPVGCLSHKDYYKQVVSKYAEENDPVYKDFPIEFTEIPMPDFAATDNVLTSTVLQAANYILQGEEEINLYIDFNGGPRTLAF